MPRRAAAVALCLAAASARAEVTVEPRGTRLDLKARSAPLSEVLDRLARQTGMKVAYEGAAPRQPVTLTLVDRSPLEAVLALLEGQGINFALVSDEKNGRVQTLILAGRAAASTNPAPQRPAPRPTFQPAPEPDVFEPEPDMAEEPPTGEDPAAAAGPPPTGPEATAPPRPPAGDPGASTAVPPNQPPVPGPPAQEWPVSPFMPQPPVLQPPQPPAPGQPQPPPTTQRGP